MVENIFDKNNFVELKSYEISSFNKNTNEENNSNENSDHNNSIQRTVTLEDKINQLGLNNIPINEKNKIAINNIYELASELPSHQVIWTYSTEQIKPFLKEKDLFIFFWITKFF